MKTFLSILGLCSFLLSCNSSKPSCALSDVEKACMEGVSSDTTFSKCYLTAGERAWCVGWQDGTFPDINSHIPRDGGGLWAPPVKIADGFSLRIDDVLLSKPDFYTTYPYAGTFTYRQAVEGLEVERLQFIPQNIPGMLVRYRIKNTGSQVRNLSLRFSVRLHLFPSWESNRVGISDGPDSFQADNTTGTLLATDDTNHWAAVCRASNWNKVQADEVEELNTHEGGHTGTIFSSLNIKGGKTADIWYFIAGEEHGIDHATAACRSLEESPETLLSENKALYTSILNRSVINIPDTALQSAYNWARIGTQWLAASLRDKRFLQAGALTYPWLFGCDNSYSIQGVAAIGDHELGEQTLSALKEVSVKTNGNGRIIHEMLPFGAVYNPGNTQETAHFIVAVRELFRWTGNVEWLRTMFPYMEKGLDWLYGERDKNANGFPEGPGIMEVRGLDAELIDVAVYSSLALRDMAEMAVFLGENDKAKGWLSRADSLCRKINREFWDEERGLYCDFFGKREDAVRVAREASLQYPKNADYYLELAKAFESLPEGTEHGFITNANWVISTPMETGMAPSDRALRALDIIREKHCGAYGPYLSAIDKDHFMTISTGVQAVAEARYGRIDEAIWYLDCIAATLHRTLPGSMNEMMPDYGCPVQAWTIYGLARTIVGFVFGIAPEAASKTVSIAPNLPTGWDDISISNVRVGTMTCSMKVHREGASMQADITTDDPTWTFRVELPCQTKAVELSGKKTYRVKN